MKVKESDTGVILIDEFEKGDSVIYNYFLDVLENGKMTNSQGEDIDLNGYIIIFTSKRSPRSVSILYIIPYPIHPYFHKYFLRKDLAEEVLVFDKKRTY